MPNSQKVNEFYEALLIGINEIRRTMDLPEIKDLKEVLENGENESK